jgi:hypothetical protein
MLTGASSMIGGPFHSITDTITMPGSCGTTA